MSVEGKLFTVIYALLGLIFVFAALSPLLDALVWFKDLLLGPCTPPDPMETDEDGVLPPQSLPTLFSDSAACGRGVECGAVARCSVGCTRAARFSRLKLWTHFNEPTTSITRRKKMKNDVSAHGHRFMAGASPRRAGPVHHNAR